VVRSISVLLPILNGARYLDRVLAALASQRTECAWDFLALDCGSTDGTLAIFERHAKSFPVPLRVRAIDKQEFNHGCTRNLLAALSGGELLVYITDDAIPLGDAWLATLAKNFDDPRVGAAYSRNVTRPEASVLVRVQNESDPAYGTQRREARIEDAASYSRMDPEARRLLYNYCDSASAMRRELWTRHPYPRCTFGEDVLQARAFLEAGYTVVFDERAAVEHSHDFGAAETAKRARLDGEFHVEWLDRVPVRTRKTAERLVRRQLRADYRALRGAGVSGRALVRELFHARELRRAHFLGLLEGARSRRRIATTKMLASERVRALAIVGAGASARTGEYAASLARGLVTEGHAVDLVREEELDARPPSLAAYDLVHFHDPGPSSLTTLVRVLEARRPFLVQLHEESVADCGAEILFACRRADLALAGTRGLRARLLAEAGFGPLQLAYSPRAGSPDERPRDLDEHALELSFRYRALACRSSELPPSVILDSTASLTARRIALVRETGAGALLLGPGEGGAEYGLRDMPDGPIEVDLHVGFTGLPKHSVVRGRILLDGHPRARFGPLEAEKPCETRILTLRIEDGSRARRLRVENGWGNGGAEGALRLERLVVHRVALGKRRPREILAALGAKVANAFEVPPRIGA
jgi:rhamnosyltransferase